MQYTRRVLKTGMFSSRTVMLPVTRFIFPSDAFVKFMANMTMGRFALPVVVQGDPDLTMWRMQCWMVENLIYGPDTFWGAPEHWLLPEETHEAMLGKVGVDCEDGANYFASMALSVGVPVDRVWVSAGNVDMGDGQVGGHAYLVYQRMSDNQPVVLDWCYRQDAHLTMGAKPIYAENRFYDPPWFSYAQGEIWEDHSKGVIDRVRKIETDKTDRTGGTDQNDKTEGK